MKKNGHKQIKTIKDLAPDTLNANKGTPRGLQMVEDSLRTYGAGRSILVDKKGSVIAGNKTLQSASDIDLPIRVVETDGKELVVVQRTDLDLNSKKARELGIADNRSSQVGLEWDADILSQLKDEGVELSGMFTEKELAALLPQGESKDAEPQIDKAAELQQKWQVATGEILTIGPHVLLCGDSGLAGDVFKLMGDKKGDLGFTDPPYNIDYEYVSYKDNKPEREYESFCERWFRLLAEHSKHQILTIGKQNLGMWHRLSPITEVAAWVHKNGVSGGKVSNLSLWEPIIFVGDFPRDSRPSNLFEYELRRQQDVGDSHTCPKQLALWQDIVQHYSQDGDLIVDFFAGSGTTLVAAENLNRTCYAMEISPEYCAVTLERMTTAFPHLKIQREVISRAA